VIAGVRVSIVLRLEIEAPKKRTIIREPVVAVGLRRCIASKIASRVFSLAQTAA